MVESVTNLHDGATRQAYFENHDQADGFIAGLKQVMRGPYRVAVLSQTYVTRYGRETIELLYHVAAVPAGQRAANGGQDVV